MDAPVSGSKAQAEGGSLIFLCSGDQSVHEKTQDHLKAMGKANFFFGNAGQGAKVKLLVNMLMGANMTAFAESLALCEAAGLSVRDLLQVLDLGAIGCPMYQGKGLGMAGRQYSPAFPLKHAQKDMGYVKFFM